MSNSGTTVERTRGLWHNRAFLLFWGAQSTSLTGTAVSFIALPLVGLVVLDASAIEMGALVTASRLPPLVFGAVVGAVVDRLPRRRLMIVCDVAASQSAAEVAGPASPAD